MHCFVCTKGSDRGSIFEFMLKKCNSLIYLRMIIGFLPTHVVENVMWWSESKAGINDLEWGAVEHK